ncbi:mast cell protease 1A-like [Fundulus heteroclitus]|uniref:mast cell protease 1A-like n=1 Tax=Fundulus heteroclitus TaxID=8078 RepID=UPI00165ABC1F|nr:mast cell protease 1A-like [Fundulus heteroclitus]
MIDTGSIICILLLVGLTGASESGIFGGKVSKPHSKPYMASLQQNRVHICGGMLVRKDFVLTAAHCKPDQVVLGAHDISKEEKSQQRIKVAKSYRHPNFKGKFDYDIMLLKLANNATLNKNVRLIELPKKETKKLANLECLTAGWGRTGPKQPISTVLKEAKEKTQSDIDCDNVWKKHFIPQQMICTKFSKKKGGICQGDSGGPLICNNKLQGITAFTADGKCDNPTYPHVFTKIHFFLPWINKIMQK